MKKIRKDGTDINEMAIQRNSLHLYTDQFQRVVLLEVGIGAQNESALKDNGSYVGALGEGCE